MASKLRALKSKVSGFVAKNKGKLAIGAGVLATGALAYGGYKLAQKMKGSAGGRKRKITIARVRNKRRLIQEKTRLLRAQRSYNKQVELQ